MEKAFLLHQKRRIERRLRYYSDRRVERIPEYRSFKKKKVIPQLHLALARIASGEYGRCISCGGPIDKERLLAVPGANRCVRCQKVSESN